MFPSASSFLTATTALAAVLGLIWLVRHAMCATRLTRRPDAIGRLAVLDTLALDPRRRLHLVRCQDRCVLLLTGAAQDLVVGWIGGAPLDDPPLPAKAGGAP